MRKFGLIGYPLAHSFSKQYFSDKFHNEQIRDCRYDNYPLEDIDKLKPLIDGDPELEGLNVTIPYKSDVLRFLDRLSPEAEAIGAVNVIKISRQGTKSILSGYNSDVTGILSSLNPVLGTIRNAIIFGTGGSSRAVCYVLKKSGLNLTLVSRSTRPGAIMYSDLDPVLMAKTDLFVNTTPLGMFPNIDTKPDLDYNLLGHRHILFDLVYNPELTMFLKMGKDRGCVTISGLNMLYSQAEKAWEIWNDDQL